MMTDPLSDFLTRIRNAYQAGHNDLTCPSSRLRLAVARVLVDEGFLASAEVEAHEGKPRLRVQLRYDDDGSPIIDGIRRVSRPGRRVYVGVDRIPRVRSGLGTAVLSTPKGIVSDRTARAEAVGGEVLCEVW
jgi:small subunit ribosomal protein S8